MSIENQTLAHFRHFSSLFTNLPSTTVEKPLQISSFLTNKANFPDDQMNVSSFLTKEYENISNWTLGENKPNTKPNKANFPRAQDDIRHPTYNIRNTNPIQSQSNPIPPPLLEHQINISMSSFYIYTSPGLYMRVVDYWWMGYNHYPSFKAMEEIVKLYKKYRDNISKINSTERISEYNRKGVL